MERATAICRILNLAEPNVNHVTTWYWGPPIAVIAATELRWSCPAASDGAVTALKTILHAQ
jgi:hypothetical protein